MALKVLLCSGNDALPQHWSILRAKYTLNRSRKNHIRLLGGLSPINSMLLCGSQGLMWGTRGHFCWQRQLSAMVMLAHVGRWRLTSDRSTVGIVEIVCGSNFFHSYVDPIYSWHLTRQLKKENLDLCTFAFSWFLCPVFYGSGVFPTLILYLWITNTYKWHVFVMHKFPVPNLILC